jgi:hypothetical protein
MSPAAYADILASRVRNCGSYDFTAELVVRTQEVMVAPEADTLSTRAPGWRQLLPHERPSGLLQAAQEGHPPGAVASQPIPRSRRGEERADALGAEADGRRREVAQQWVEGSSGMPRLAAKAAAS